MQQLNAERDLGLEAQYIISDRVLQRDCLLTGLAQVIRVDGDLVHIVSIRGDWRRTRVESPKHEFAKHIVARWVLCELR